MGVQLDYMSWRVSGSIDWDFMEFIIWTPAHQSLLSTDDDITLLAGAGPAHSPGLLGAELPGL